MKGVIIKVNYIRGLAVFETEDGDYGYFEILGNDSLEKDDIIIGDLHSLGGETIIKIPTKETIKIFIEDYGMSLNLALEKIN